MPFEPVNNGLEAFLFLSVLSLHKISFCRLTENSLCALPTNNIMGYWRMHMGEALDCANTNTDISLNIAILLPVMPSTGGGIRV